MGRIFLVSLVSKRCETCKYKGEVLFGELCCDYILITGKKRGCPAGDECDKGVLRLDTIPLFDLRKKNR